MADMSPKPPEQFVSKATADVLLQIDQKGKEQLAEINDLLVRLYTRNKNQHRHSHWFKSLSILRKELGNLLEELSTMNRTKLEARLKFWDSNHIHMWYL